MIQYNACRIISVLCDNTTRQSNTQGGGSSACWIEDGRGFRCIFLNVIVSGWLLVGELPLLLYLAYGFKNSNCSGDGVLSTLALPLTTYKLCEMYKWK